MGGGDGRRGKKKFQNVIKMIIPKTEINFKKLLFWKNVKAINKNKF